MGGSSFDLIAQEIIKQQRLMDKLTAENRELRRQITNLRAAQGIFIEIGGKRIALREDTAIPDAVSASASPLREVPPSLTETPTTARAKAHKIEDLLIEEDEDEKANIPDSLGEIIHHEFTSASENPTATQSKTIKKRELTEEEQKATLRRELMGSFLLE